MKLVSQYGHDALNLFDWIGWTQSEEYFTHAYDSVQRELKEKSREEIIESIKGSPLLHSILNYRKHLSQPMTKEMFMRGEEPKVFRVKDFETDHKAWENWQPLFEGEWEFDQNDYIMHWFFTNKVNDEILQILKEGITLNDFLTENKGLKWNENFEI